MWPRGFPNMRLRFPQAPRSPWKPMDVHGCPTKEEKKTEKRDISSVFFVFDSLPLYLSGHSIVLLCILTPMRIWNWAKAHLQFWIIVVPDLGSRLLDLPQHPSLKEMQASGDLSVIFVLR